VYALRCLSRSCTCDRTERRQKTENFQTHSSYRRVHPHVPAQACTPIYTRGQDLPCIVCPCVPACAWWRYKLSPVIIFRVQNGQIFTFCILTHGVEAAQACLIHRSSTHATTLTRVGSIGFTWVKQGAGEKAKLESPSGILIVRPISCNSPIDHALHASWHVLPTHITASP
jgi:hypothetical protein